MARTMWRRKPEPDTSKHSSRPRSSAAWHQPGSAASASTAALVTRRTVDRTGLPWPWNAAKSCSPTKAAAASGIAATDSRCGTCQATRRSAG